MGGKVHKRLLWLSRNRSDRLLEISDAEVLDNQTPEEVDRLVWVGLRPRVAGRAAGMTRDSRNTLNVRNGSVADPGLMSATGSERTPAFYSEARTNWLANFTLYA